MRKIEVKDGNFTLRDKVKVVFERRVTPFGHSAKVGVPRKYVNKRVYIIILDD